MGKKMSDILVAGELDAAIGAEADSLDVKPLYGAIPSTTWSP
jgi:hypothetical protein